MDIISTYNYRLPVWAVCPLVNSDNSTLNEIESKNIEDFENRLNDLVIKDIANHYTIEYPDNIDDEKYFSTVNCLNKLGDNIIDIKVHIFK